jgi:hypothetical protein
MDNSPFNALLENAEEALFSFGTAPEDRKQEMLDKHKEVFDEKPSTEYDEHGLRFTVDHLDKVGNNAILMPVELMAEYVDVITKHKVDSNDQSFINDILTTEIYQDELDNINATACGNLAYAYLHTTNDYAKQHVKQIITKLFTWRVMELKEFHESQQN